MARLKTADDPAALAALNALNERQREAVEHGLAPLLVIAGAGSGKTRTLVHRVAHLISRGADPGRILLLTFSRRAAAEMLRRVDTLLGQAAAGSRSAGQAASKRLWGGTFHAVAARLLRLHGKSIGLDPAFTIHDRGDSEDLLDVVRTELGLSKTDKRFPKKGTCLSIYSHCVNSRRPLAEVLGDNYPWCQDYTDELKRLFQAYVDRKEQLAVLDYDDLLLFWQGLVSDPQAGAKVRERFDWVLVDEYQDTNALQADILRGLRPDGQGLTAVGDDAQSIYSFRAATVRNILDFPAQFADTKVVKLEQNYRSGGQILAATNLVIAQARERFTKQLWSDRPAGEQPWLVTCHDEDEQAEFLIGKILAHREAGIELRQQAVLFRASHHSMLLEAELARHNIPFVKYGGLKFLETAHVKDLMSFLRLAENPRDLVAGLRVLTLLPGVGPKKARQWLDSLREAGGDFASWSSVKPPAAATEQWQPLVKLLSQLTSASGKDVQGQVALVRRFYGPLLDQRYDNPAPRQRDLEQLEHLAGRFASRSALLSDMALDPPASTEDLAGPPLLDEDYLILSTIHSAKGLEWDSVYVIHAADGNIPSDMATGSAEQIEEELRLFYVALTRARNWLYVCFPQRYFQGYRGSFSDRYGMAQLTRFLPAEVQASFQRHAAVPDSEEQEEGDDAPVSQAANIRQRTKALWS